MRNFRITFLIVGCLFVFGIYALARIPKQEFPEYTIRQGVVVGVYPGATAEEVEEQLAKPLEQFLMTYREVKRAKTTSTSQNGMCYVMVELNDDVNDKDEVWSKVKHGLAAFKMQLPAGVAAVVTNDDFGDTSALLITLESDTRSYRELKGYMDDLSDRLRRIESVSNLRPYGVQQEQISVYADPERLAAYGIGEKTLSAALAAQGLTPLGGSVSNAETETPIHIAPSLAGEREVAEQIVWSDPEGHVLRVKDVARVVREYDDPDSYIRNNGHRCVLLSLEMQAGNNIVEYGREVDEVLHAFIEEELPADVSVQRIADQAKVVGDSVHSFLRDLFVAMAIIIVVMMLLFPLRSAIVAALTIPMSTFISVGMMYLCGIPLNTVTLAALVVVLGMIVDNSIVVIDGYLDYLGRGHSRWFAAVESAREFFPSLLLATICICMIFYPILFTMTGMMGDFLTWFPWTITINLMVSLLLAVMVIPFLEILIIPAVHVRRDGRRSFTDRVHDVYRRVLAWTFRHGWLTISLGAASVVVSLLIATQLKFRMVPFADRDQFAVEIYLRPDTPLERTGAVADSVYRALRADERVKSVTSFVGCSSPRFQMSYAPQIAGKNYAQFIVNTTSVDDTESILDEYADAWADRFPRSLRQVQAARLPERAVARIPLLRQRHRLAARRGRPADGPHAADARTAMGAYRLRGPAGDRRGAARSRHGVAAGHHAHGRGRQHGPGVGRRGRGFGLGGRLQASGGAQARRPAGRTLAVGHRGHLCLLARAGGERAPAADRRRGTRVEPVEDRPPQRHALHHRDGRPETRRQRDADDLAHQPDAERRDSAPAGRRDRVGRRARVRRRDPAAHRRGVEHLAGDHLFLHPRQLPQIRHHAGRHGLDVAVSVRRDGRIVDRRLHHRADLGAGFHHPAGHDRAERDPDVPACRGQTQGLPLVGQAGGLRRRKAPHGPDLPHDGHHGRGRRADDVGRQYVLGARGCYDFRRRHRFADPRGHDPSGSLLQNLQVMKKALVYLILCCTALPAGAQTLTLDECRAAAAEHNRTLRDGRFELEAALQTRREALTGYFPQVSATGGVFQAQHGLVQADFGMTIPQLGTMNLPLSMVKRGLVGGVTAVQPVFAGLKIVNGNKLARLGEEVGRLQLQKTESEVREQTDAYYWQVVSLRDNLSTIEAVERQLEEIHRQVELSVKAGLVTTNDLLRVELRQQEIASNRLKVENGLKVSKMLLAQHIGVDWRAFDVAAAEFGQPEAPAAFYVPVEEALDNRAEYRLAEKNVEAQKYRKRMERGKRLPTVGVGAGYLYYNVTDKDVDDGLVFAQVSVPISDWWGGAHALKKARIREQQAENDRLQAREMLAVEIERTWSEVQESYAQILLTRRSVTSAAENLRQNRNFYQAGTAPLTDLLDAETLYTRSRNDFTSACAAYRTSLARYMRVTGR